MKQHMKLLLWVVVVSFVAASSGYLFYRATNSIVNSLDNEVYTDFDGVSQSIRAQVDFSDDKSLVGGLDNVFVGRVLEQVGIETPYGRPHTTFNVQVVYNLKGNAQGVVLVKQEGAMIDGAVHVVHPSESSQEIVDESENNLLLTPGHTYLLLVEYKPKRSNFYLAYQPIAQEEISADDALTNEELDRLVRQNERVYELLAAYVNEVPYRSNILNRFDLLSEAERQAVFDRFSNLIPPHPVPEITPKSFDFSEPAIENVITYCFDGADNDKDGLTDFADPECKQFFIENNPGLCRDGTDDDADGLIDAADPDCAPFYPQPVPPPPPAGGSTSSGTSKGQ